MSAGTLYKEISLKRGKKPEEEGICNLHIHLMAVPC